MPVFKRILLAALLSAPLCVWAADDKAKSPQQEKMAACNKEAADKGLKGDQRKTFMSGCLSAGKSQAKLSQQEKKKSCNKEAADKALNGDDRKKFMSQCLKGSVKS